MSSRETLLKTQQVAQALGVSVSTIKRWVDAGALRAIRTVGKHRLVSLAEALRFAREHSMPLTGLESLNAAPTTESEDLVEPLVRALSQGDAALARSLMVRAHASTSVVDFADNLIRPVMTRIGHGWMVGSLEIYQEHQASQIVSSVLSELIASTPEPKRGAPLAVGAGPEGDLYSLSLMLGELVLRELGWDVRNLGPNLPLSSLAGAVLEYRPKLAFLTVSNVSDTEKLCRDYKLFHQAAKAVDTAVVIGGRALGADLRARLNYASFGERMAHLAEFAMRLNSPGGPSASRATASRDIDTTSLN
ncbi:MAG: helix-turn-helix domain-containing protein [Isosphaeraceae bacterium]